METIVLLKVARTCAIPVPTFLLPLALMILGFSASVPVSESVGLAAAAAPVEGGAPSFFVVFVLVVFGAFGSPAPVPLGPLVPDAVPRCSSAIPQYFLELCPLYRPGFP